MTTPTGQISLTDVKNEFGRAAPVGDTTGTAISLGKYRVNDASTFNKPLSICSANAIFSSSSALAASFSEAFEPLPLS